MSQKAHCYDTSRRGDVRYKAPFDVSYPMGGKSNKIVEYRGVYRFIGPPGTGKTEMARRQVEALVGQYGPDCVLVTSLTRAAARTIAARIDIPEECVGTLHSHAYRKIGRPPLYSKFLDEWKEEYPQYPVLPPAGMTGKEGAMQATVRNTHEVYTSFVTRAVHKCLTRGRTPENSNQVSNLGDFFPPVDDVSFILNYTTVSREEWPTWFAQTVDALPAGAFNFIESWTSWLDRKHCVDFDNMLLGAIVSPSPTPPGDPQFIIVDEAQDCAPLEIALIAHWCQHVDALFLLGDPWQSIYEFRGADASIWFDPDLPDGHEKILHQSYRLSAPVHKLATGWIKKELSTWKPIEYKPHHEEGEVANLDFTYKHATDLADFIESRLPEGETIMLVASCDYLLRPAIAELRKRGIPYHNQYAPTNGEWNPLAISNRKKVVTTRDRIEAFMQSPEHWTMEDAHLVIKFMMSQGILVRGAKTQVSKMATDDPKAPFQAHSGDIFIKGVWEDICSLKRDWSAPKEAFKWFYSRLQASKQKTAMYLMNTVMSYGPDALSEMPKLTVGTIHSVKGGEADTVILAPDISSAMYEAMSDRKGYDNVAKQFYVGFTRSKYNLFILSPHSHRLSIDAEALV